MEERENARLRAKRKEYAPKQVSREVQVATTSRELLTKEAT